MHSWQPSMASIRWQRWCWRCIFYWEQPHLGRWGRWQGHPYLSQNNVSDLIPSRPMRYIYFEVGVSLYLMDPRDHWPVKNSDTLRIFPTAKRILWTARLGRNNLDICQSVMLNASLSCIGYCIYIYSYIYALHWLEIWFENEMLNLISSNKFWGSASLVLEDSFVTFVSRFSQRRQGWGVT